MGLWFKIKYQLADIYQQIQLTLKKVPFLNRQIEVEDRPIVRNQRNKIQIPYLLQAKRVTCGIILAINTLLILAMALREVPGGVNTLLMWLFVFEEVIFVDYLFKSKPKKVQEAFSREVVYER